MEPNNPTVQNPQQPQVTVLKNPENTPKSSKKKILIFLAAILLILLFIISIAGAYWYGKSSTLSTPESVRTTNENKVEMHQEITISPTIMPEANWKIYTSKQLPGISFNPFSIKYPETWTLTSVGYPDYDLTKITKNSYNLEIYQAAFGGAGCIFDGEVPEGPYGDYRNLIYTDINTELGTLRRFIDPDAQKNKDETIFSFCISTDNALFGSPTIIGGITYTVPSNYSEANIKELDSIIKTLKVSE